MSGVQERDEVLGLWFLSHRRVPSLSAKLLVNYFLESNFIFN